jgi:hypothetical protein
MSHTHFNFPDGGVSMQTEGFQAVPYVGDWYYNLAGTLGTALDTATADGFLSLSTEAVPELQMVTSNSSIA